MPPGFAGWASAAPEATSRATVMIRRMAPPPMADGCHGTPPGNMIPVMSDDVAGLFAPLSPHPVSFAAGSAVFRIGDPVRRVYLVHTGAIHLVRHHRNGVPLILQRAGPGSILAEASVFSDRYH